MDKNKPWCYAPFGHIDQHAEGHFAPCCAWNDNAPELNKTSSIYEAFNSDFMIDLRERMLNHDIPDNCSKCVNREKNKGISNRQSFQTTAVSNWPADIIDNPRIVDLEISFSNFCNLKCRMCHSGLSTSWAKDQKAIKHLDYVNDVPTHHVENAPVDTRALEHVKILHFKGGEPLLDPQFKTFINDIDIQQVERIKLTTNGTFFNQEVFERLALAKKIQVDFSVDAVNDSMYRYIRGGKSYGIKSAENNLKKIIDVFQGHKGHKVHLNFTMQAYNLFEYNKIVDWWQEIRSYNSNIVTPAQTPNIIIMYPQYLRMGVLPLDFRKRVADELYTNDPKVYEFVTQPQLPGLNQFIEYTQTLDKLRNESLLQAEPRFAPLFDQYK